MAFIDFLVDHSRLVTFHLSERLLPMLNLLLRHDYVLIRFVVLEGGIILVLLRDELLLNPVVPLFN